MWGPFSWFTRTYFSWLSGTGAPKQIWSPGWRKTGVRGAIFVFLLLTNTPFKLCKKNDKITVDKLIVDILLINTRELPDSLQQSISFARGPTWAWRAYETAWRGASVSSGWRLLQSCGLRSGAGRDPAPRCLEHSSRAPVYGVQFLHTLPGRSELHALPCPTRTCPQNHRYRSVLWALAKHRQRSCCLAIALAS